LLNAESGQTDGGGRQATDGKPSPTPLANATPSNPPPGSAAASFNLAASEMTPSTFPPSPTPPSTAASGSPTPTVGAPSTADGDASADSLNGARLARGLQSVLNQRGGSVTLRLTPPEMGTVRIQLQLQGGTVAAQFHAESNAARGLLTQQLAQLRTALEGQGLQVDRLSVHPMSHSHSGTAQQETGTNQQGSPHSQQSANDGRSRGQWSSGGGQGHGRDPSDGDSQDESSGRRDRGFEWFRSIFDAAGEQAA